MLAKEAATEAKKRNLKGIAFTDHLDLNAPGEDDRFTFDPALQQNEVERIQKLFDIEIYKGVEIGLQPDNLTESRDFVLGNHFDTVIASVHFVDGLDPYRGSYYEGKTEIQGYGRYLELIAQLIEQFGDFDILGHYDYIARYAPYKNRTIYYSQYSDYFEYILKYLAYNGKALEINTNTYRARNGLAPELDVNVLKQFARFGGEFITLGSDAHSADRIGEGFEKYGAIIKNCGFSYITHYKERKPVPVKI